MDKTCKPFTPRARVRSISMGHAGIVIRQVWHQNYGWRVHYYVPTADGTCPISYRVVASDLELLEGHHDAG